MCRPGAYGVASIEGLLGFRLLVDDVENKEFLKNLFEAMYDELPVLKKKKK